MNAVIGHSRPTITEGDIDAVRRTLRSGWLAQGMEVRNLEEEMANFIGLKDGVCVSSGTAALHLALIAAGVREGDRVVIPGYCCPSVLHAVRLTGGLPVLADVDPRTLTIDVDDLRKKVGKGAGGIVLVHLLGYPGPVEIVKEFDVPVIEDCAQSLGALAGGRPVGSFGVASILSFYATKLITTGEGGMVLSNNVELLSKVGDMRSVRTTTGKMAFTYTMSDIQAALGRSQLHRLNSFLEKRRKLAGRYRSELSCTVTGFIEETKGSKPAYYRFVVELDADIEGVIRGMEERGIECRRPFEEPVFTLVGEDNLKGCRHAHSKFLSLPIYPSLEEEEVLMVAHTLIELIERTG